MTNFQKWKQELDIYTACALITSAYNCNNCPAAEYCETVSGSCDAVLRTWLATEHKEKNCE